jgi:hypothetical protein
MGFGAAAISLVTHGLISIPGDVPEDRLVSDGYIGDITHAPVTGLPPNVVPIRFVVGTANIVPIRLAVGPANVVPVREVTTTTANVVPVRFAVGPANVVPVRVV